MVTDLRRRWRWRIWPSPNALEVRIAAIKALVQQAIANAPKNTATRVLTPLREALTK